MATHRPAIILILLLLVACQTGPPPAATLVPATPEPTVAPSLVGRPLKGSLPAVYRLMEDGHIRHVTDWPTFLALGYEPYEIVDVPDETLRRYPLAQPLTRWLLAESDASLYVLRGGQRYPIPSLDVLQALGGDAQHLSTVSDAFLAHYPPASAPLDTADLAAASEETPAFTAALWAEGGLWVADAAGSLVRHDVEAGEKRAFALPGQPTVTALARIDGAVYAGTDAGDLWRLGEDGAVTPVVDGPPGKVAAILADSAGQLWYALASHMRAELRSEIGAGLIAATPDAVRATTSDPASGADDPSRHISALAFDPRRGALWAGTRFAGVLRYDLSSNVWQSFNAWNGGPADQTVADVEVAADGVVWVGTGYGTYLFQDGVWERQAIADEMMGTGVGALALAMADDNTVWVAGDRLVAHRQTGQPWQVASAFDHPMLDDRFELLVLDEEARPWFFGRERVVHWDGVAWIAYDHDLRPVRKFAIGEPLSGATSPPRDFPSPTARYTDWLETWPRPAGDNGRGVHFANTFWFDEAEVRRNIERMKRLGVRWTVYSYVTRDQLLRAAPLFREAGIMVVWRPMVRPFDSYAHWAEDVTFLRSRGIPPYVQLYNEPSLAQEWDADHPIDMALYLRHLMPAIRQVYDAGGYVGLQAIDPEELRDILRTMKAEGLSDVFDRLFFIPHPYGLNHPPAYAEDINAVLGFREYARIFREEIDFIPIMIAGEGGWRPGEAQDSRYPAVSEVLHRDYHLAVYDWFRSGQMSNNEPLPDYLLAFCTWLLSDPHDPAAWFDSDAGDRALTIQALAAATPFERRFSWSSLPGVQ